MVDLGCYSLTSNIILIRFRVWNLQLRLSLRNSFEDGVGMAMNDEDKKEEEINTVLSLSLSSSSPRQQEDEDCKQTSWAEYLGSDHAKL